ncbi:hypothetical protein HKD37_06G015291 [Glycine soja]
MPGSILSAFLDAMEEETELHCIAHAHVSSTKGGKRGWIYKEEVNRYLFGGKGKRVIDVVEEEQGSTSSVLLL